MLIEGPVLDVVDQIHVAREVPPGLEVLADAALDHWHFRRGPLAPGKVAKVHEAVALGAVGAPSLMVPDGVLRGEPLGALPALFL